MRNFYPKSIKPVYLFKINSAKKYWDKLLPISFLLFSTNTFSQSNHTVTFTNSSSDFTALEKISASAGNTDYYITFDQNNLYIGAFRTTGNFAANDNLAIYIDTDPQSNPTTGNGSATGKSYNGVTATLPFNADYNVYAEQSTQQSNSYSGGWAAFVGPTYFTSLNSREVKIPFTTIGSPYALNITMWMGNAGSIYSNAPGANIASSAPVIVNYFGTFGIKNGAQGNVNPVNIITTPATGYLAGAASIAGGTYSYIDITGNTTINGLTLAPGGVINVEAGKTLISTGTINNTAITNNTKSTQVNVSGTYELQGKAYCSLFNVNNGGTYNHNSAGSVANGDASDWPGIDTRTYGATSNINILQWAQSGATLPIGIPTPTSDGWGNVTINVSFQTYTGNWHQMGAFNNVAGNLILKNLGLSNATTQFFSFYQQKPPGDTINIGGNFQMSTSPNNGIILCQNDDPGPTGASTHIMNVHGDFIVTGGHIKFGYHYANAIINYWGNYSQTGGEVKTGTDVGIKDTINAYGVNKTISATGGSFNTNDFVWVITKNAMIDLASDMYFFGNSQTDPSNCIIIVNGRLNCNQYKIIDWYSFLIWNNPGGVTFTLSPAGTLSSGNSNGIISTGNNSGSIQTKYRNFSTQANYVYNGTSNQVTGTGLPATVNSLTINNLSNSNIVSLTNSVAITSYHEIDKGIFSLGNNNVTLHSDANGTASFNVLPPVGASITYDGTGRYIVERYINLGSAAGQHGKSWQFLSTPANGGTVHNTWQEGGSTTISGYGTWITDASYPANGFDAFSYTPGMKYYNPAANDWIGISSTSIAIANPIGYMLFVRGDRNARAVNSPPIPTTLRITGKLFAGTQPAAIVPANSFQSIGNPYASAVSFQTLFSNSSNIDNVFYVWDPSLSGNYGVGGYQTVSEATGYIAIPGMSTIYKSTTDYSNIQSGDAIFVHNSSGTPGSVIFTEDCKRTGSILVNRQSNFKSERQLLFAGLYTSSGVMADGNAVAFDYSFSNKIDKDDAIKLMNAGENFGIKRDDKILAVEARLPVMQYDTIFYDMHNLSNLDYRLVFVPKNPGGGLDAFLIDQYLKTEKPVSLSDSTFINFSITSDAASSAANRFMIVFRPAAALAVTFISVNAYKQNGNILVEWKVENENNMQQYELEHSTDGIYFSRIATVAPINISKNTYDYIDNNPSAGNNYYRIRSVEKDGKGSYSRIVKIFMGNLKSSISVYPNPLAGENINLQFIDQQAGNYHVRLLNSLGETMLSKEINYTGGSNTKNILFNKSAAQGIYHLEIIKPDGEKIVLKVRR